MEPKKPIVRDQISLTLETIGNWVRASSNLKLQQWSTLSMTLTGSYVIDGNVSSSRENTQSGGYSATMSLVPYHISVHNRYKCMKLLKGSNSGPSGTQFVKIISVHELFARPPTDTCRSHLHTPAVLKFSNHVARLATSLRSLVATNDVADGVEFPYYRTNLTFYSRLGYEKSADGRSLYWLKDSVCKSPSTGAR